MPPNCASRPARWPRSFAQSKFAAALLLTIAACGPDGRTVTVYPSASPYAEDVYRVAMTQQVTQPDNFVMRPDEFGGVAIDHARKQVYVGTREGRLLALDLGSGEVRWEIELGGAVSSEPLLTDVPELEPDLGANEHRKGSMLLLGTDNGEAVALDLRTREELWRHPTDGRVRAAPVVADGVVYVANSREQVFALDQRTGAWRWQYDQPLPADFTVAGSAGLTLRADVDGVESGVLYTGFGNGKVVALDATSGEALWLASVAPPEGGDFSDCDSTPLVSESEQVLYVAGQSTGVYALALADGTPRWQFGVQATGDLVRGAGTDVVGASSLEGVFALDRDGVLLWRTEVDPGVLSRPVVTRDVVHVAHSERGLLTFALETGELVSRVDPGSGMSSIPVFDDIRERLYVTSNRGVLFEFALRGAV